MSADKAGEAKRPISKSSEITSELNFRPNTGPVDQVTIEIGKKLARLPSWQSNYSTCIFRVDDQLRKGNEKAYEPEVIAIGPYHHGRADLQVMEEHKLHYFRSLLLRNENNPDKYVAAMRSLVGNMSCCYADPIGLDEDEWVEMMVLDSCFVIEFIQKFHKHDLRDGDRILKIGRVLLSVQRDLMLVENQLPLFVLCKMFDVINDNNYQDKSLFSLILNFFGGLVPRISLQLPAGNERECHVKMKHMLGVIHGTILLSLASTDMGSRFALFERFGSCRNRNDNSYWDFIPSVTELTYYCVQFEKSEKSLLEIEFLNGIMKLPPLSIEDGTETLLRNLVAHEQYLEYNASRAVTEYVKFLGRLIDSPKDVAILRERQIISTSIRDNEVISNIFKNIAYSATEPVILHLYYKICKDVHTHCKRRIITNWKIHTKRWMVMLWGSYLNSPWRVISILAATILLVLTFIQTLFTVYPRK